MATERGEKRVELPFLALMSGAQRLGIFVILAAWLCNSTAQTQAALPNVPATAQKAVAVPAPDTAITSAMKAHNERLAILVQERNETSERLQKTKASGDAAAIARLVADLATLDREIATVSREPINEIKRSTPQNKNASMAQSSESQPSARETTYEGWDIFKNFGRKGTQQ